MRLEDTLEVPGDELVALGSPVRVGEGIGHTAPANSIAKHVREVEAGQPVAAAELLEQFGKRPERPLAELAVRRDRDEVPIHAELDGDVDQQQMDIALANEPHTFSERVLGPFPSAALELRPGEARF